MIRQPNQLFQSPNQPNYVQGGGGGGGQPGPLDGMLKQMAGMGVKTALAGTPMAPLSGMLGGLFNNGGSVGGHNPDTFINGKIASVHYPTPGPAQNGPIGLNSGGKTPSLAEQINWGGKYSKPKRKTKAPERAWYDPRGYIGRNDGGSIPHYNMGGPLSANPQGYNEGGSAGETPIKKVMDEQKLDQQAVAFERDQARKQEMHDITMKQKEQQFATAQKMKKAAATTSKKPKAPLAAGKK